MIALRIKKNILRAFIEIIMDDSITNKRKRRKEKGKMSSLLLLSSYVEEVAVGYTVGLISLILYRIQKWIIKSMKYVVLKRSFANL